MLKDVARRILKDELRDKNKKIFNSEFMQNYYKEELSNVNKLMGDLSHAYKELERKYGQVTQQNKQLTKQVHVYEMIIRSLTNGQKGNTRSRADKRDRQES